MDGREVQKEARGRARIPGLRKGMRIVGTGFGLGSDSSTSLGARVATDQMQWAWDTGGEGFGSVSLGDITVLVLQPMKGCLWDDVALVPQGQPARVGVIPQEGWWGPHEKRKMRRRGSCFEGAGEAEQPLQCEAIVAETGHLSEEGVQCPGAGGRLT